MEGLVTQLSILGAKFEVPDGVLAKYDHYLTPEAPEGLRHTIRQTIIENLGNNFRKRVADALNGGDVMPEDKFNEIQGQLTEYADKYEFGIRAPGTPRSTDPIEREMIKLSKSDLTMRYKGKYNEAPPKDWLDEKVPEYMEALHDDLVKRARAIVRARQDAATKNPEVFSAMGL